VRPADNPFRTARLDAIPPLDDHGRPLDVGHVAATFAAQGYRGTLLGTHGSGKSTLRRALQAHYARAGWLIEALQLRADERPCPALPTTRAQDARLVAIDGVEQLPRARWWWWRRRYRGALLVTSHRPCGLPVLRHHRAEAALLVALVSRLLERRPDAQERAACQNLFQTHRGDLRLCLLTCYDRWQRTGSIVAPGIHPR